MINDKKLGRNQGRGALIGQAGVYAAASQLCLRGQYPLFPAVDKGYDLMLDNGIRIQVKMAHLTYPKCGVRTGPTVGVRGGSGKGNYLGGAYIFNLRRSARVRENSGWKRGDFRRYEGVADFFILWGADENRFWIVPTSVKNGTIFFGRLEHPNNSNNSSYTNALKLHRNAQYESRWDLLDVNSTVEAMIEGEPTTVAPKEI